VAHRNNSKPNNIGSVGIYKPMSLVYSSIFTDNGANRASERNAFSVRSQKSLWPEVNEVLCAVLSLKDQLMSNQ
jgi:hypothetical protein